MEPNTHENPQPNPPAENAQEAAKPRWQDKVKEKLKATGQEVWTFLKSPTFLKNFGGLLLVLLLFSLLVKGWLRSYTNHGESLQVHNYIGMDLYDAIEKAENRSFQVIISDSLFIVGESPNMVLDQDPKPLSRVKEKRRIYLTISSSTPPEMTLPDLIGSYDFDQYSRKLKRLDITAVIKERVFNGKLEENTILHFFYKGEKITDAMVKEGVKIPKGSTLEFVVTERNTGMVAIPDLICKKYSAASFLISGNNLNLGTVHGDVFDRNAAYVWKQDPAYSPGQQILMGTQVDIYLTETRPSGCPEEIEPSELDTEEEDSDPF